MQPKQKNARTYFCQVPYPKRAHHIVSRCALFFLLTNIQKRTILIRDCSWKLPALRHNLAKDSAAFSANTHHKETTRERDEHAWERNDESNGKCTGANTNIYIKERAKNGAINGGKNGKKNIQRAKKPWCSTKVFSLFVIKIAFLPKIIVLNFW